MTTPSSTPARPSRGRVITQAVGLGMLVAGAGCEDALAWLGGRTPGLAVTGGLLMAAGVSLGITRSR